MVCVEKKKCQTVEEVDGGDRYLIDAWKMEAGQLERLDWIFCTQQRRS
jgi:hypothetical protein